MILGIFTDFDGTLVNIAKTPDSVRIGKNLITVIEKLSGDRNVRVAVVTGRSLKNIKEKLPLKKIIFAGNHGLEIYIPGKGIILKAADSPKKIKFLAGKLKERLKGVKGALIEDKNFSAAIHYRNAGQKNVSVIKNTVYETIDEYAAKGDFKIMKGKKVIELMPKIKWDKGKTVLWLIKEIERSEKKKVFPVFIGDDLTDEPAFGAVNRKKGLSIFVGNTDRKTNARYRISSPSEVLRFLRDLPGAFPRRGYEKSF